MFHVLHLLIAIEGFKSTNLDKLASVFNGINMQSLGMLHAVSESNVQKESVWN